MDERKASDGGSISTRDEREAYEKAAAGHHLLRQLVEEQEDRRRIVVELCSTASDGGSISTQDVERVLSVHGVIFVVPEFAEAIRDFINSI